MSPLESSSDSSTEHGQPILQCPGEGRGSRASDGQMLLGRDQLTADVGEKQVVGLSSFQQGKSVLQDQLATLRNLSQGRPSLRSRI